MLLYHQTAAPATQWPEPIEMTWQMELSDQFRFWYGCLCDALELVDWRSGEIRDREINQWLLEETIKGLQQLHHPRVKKLVTTLKNQAAELATFDGG